MWASVATGLAATWRRPASGWPEKACRIGCLFTLRTWAGGGGGGVAGAYVEMVNSNGEED